MVDEIVEGTIFLNEVKARVVASVLVQSCVDTTPTQQLKGVGVPPCVGAKPHIVHVVLRHMCSTQWQEEVSRRAEQQKEVVDSL